MNNQVIAIAWLSGTAALAVWWRGAFLPDRTSGLGCWVAAALAAALVVGALDALIGRIRGQ